MTCRRSTSITKSDIPGAGNDRAATSPSGALSARLGSVREAVRTGSLEGSVPIEEIVPDWPARLNNR